MYRALKKTRACCGQRKYLKQNALEFNLDEFLKDANLYMDTSEAAIESGINVKSANEIKIRRMNEDGKIIYSDEGSFVYKGLKVFSSGLSKFIVGVTTWFFKLSTDTIASTAPEAPRRCPIMDLLELT